MIIDRSTRIKALGGLRLMVGLALITAPKAIGRNDDPSFALLLRTIGVRDAVLGAGTLASSGDAATLLWGRVALASDSLDVVVGTATMPQIGGRRGLVAAAAAVPFVLADGWAIRS